VATTGFAEVDDLLKMLRAFDNDAYHSPSAAASDRPRMVAMEGFIAGRAFFPGGSGLVGQDFPSQRIMVLGHDFDTKKNFEQSCADGHEDPGNKTWSGILTLFKRLEIPVEDCFFTNAYMGVRVGLDNRRQAVKPTGTNPSRSHEPYFELSSKMFAHQIATQEPKLVIALGTHVPAFLAAQDPGSLGAWAQSSFEKRDAAFAARSAMFPVGTGGSTALHTCVVASIVHPSLRDANIGKRSYRGLKGDAAEIALLADALVMAGLR
jgi:hypothetical protein